MGNLFQVLFSSIKAKVISIWTKIKLWTNLSYLKSQLFTRIRQFLGKILDVRPRDKDDYYGIWKWLVSKKLVFAITIILGIFSIWYVFFVNPPSVFRSSGNGVKTYAYNSIPLRFTKGEVRILGKSRYLAFQGEVEKGTANGYGVLYRKDGSEVYEGNFKKNKFQGNGQLYYPSGQLEYNGEFVNNKFDGKGVLYRENGSKEYDGEFLSGMKDGEGNLYDSAGNAVFTGNFSKDALMYTDFLGKSTDETRKIYTGKSVVYKDNENLVVSMADIDAVYYGQNGAENLDGNIKIEGVYVLSDTFPYSGEKYTNVFELEEIFPKTEYEGNAYVTMPEAVAIHIMNQKGTALSGDISGTWSNTLDDVIEVDSYDKDYIVYLYTYVKDKIRYTFFCKDRTGEFAMYLIQQEE